MNYVCMGICFALIIYAVINKIVSEKKFGHMKQKGQCVYLPEWFFGFGLVITVFWCVFIYSKLLFKDEPSGLYVFALAFPIMSISIAFAQANSRIYYDDDHIYYSTFFGNRYTFNYDDIIGKKRDFDDVLLTTHRPNIRVETTGIGRKKFLRFVQLKQKEIKANAKAKALEEKSKNE